MYAVGVRIYPDVSPTTGGGGSGHGTGGYFDAGYDLNYVPMAAETSTMTSYTS